MAHVIAHAPGSSGGVLPFLAIPIRVNVLSRAQFHACAGLGVDIGEEVDGEAGFAAVHQVRAAFCEGDGDVVDLGFVAAQVDGEGVEAAAGQGAAIAQRG